MLSIVMIKKITNGRPRSRQRVMLGTGQDRIGQRE